MLPEPGIPGQRLEIIPFDNIWSVLLIISFDKRWNEKANKKAKYKAIPPFQSAIS